MAHERRELPSRNVPMLTDDCTRNFTWTDEWTGNYYCHKLRILGPKGKFRRISLLKIRAYVLRKRRVVSSSDGRDQNYSSRIYFVNFCSENFVTVAWESDGNRIRFCDENQLLSMLEIFRPSSIANSSIDDVTHNQVCQCHNQGKLLKTPYP